MSCLRQVMQVCRAQIGARLVARAMVCYAHSNVEIIFSFMQRIETYREMIGLETSDVPRYARARWLSARYFACCQSCSDMSKTTPLGSLNLDSTSTPG